MAAYSHSKSGLKTGLDFSKEAYFGNGYINELKVYWQLPQYVVSSIIAEPMPAIRPHKKDVKKI